MGDLLITLIVVLGPFWFLWYTLNNSSKEKSLDDFLAHGRKVINIVVVVLLVVGFPESVMVAGAIIIAAMVFGKSGTATGGYAAFVTNQLTKMWNANHPQTQGISK